MTGCQGRAVHVALLIALGAPPAVGAAPYLVKDLNLAPAGSRPACFATIRGVAFFSADDGTHGREPWVTDGTAAGTRMVADVAPGSASSDPCDFLPVGDLVYFGTSQDTSPQALWRTDGTPEGTAPVTDRDGVGVNLLLGTTDDAFTIIAGDRLFFHGFSTTRASGQLWRAEDGLATLVRGFTPTSFLRLDSTVGRSAIFEVTVPDGHGGLSRSWWVTDGTADGTVELADETSAPTPLGDWLVSFGRVFPVTVRRRPITGGAPEAVATLAGSSLVYPVGVLHGQLLFGIGGAQAALWSTDGTTEGTVRLAPLSAPPQAPAFATTDDALFFLGRVNGQIPLWRSNGTADGTFLLQTFSAQPEVLGTLGGLVFFHELDDAADPPDRLWVTDGTVGGTVLLRSFPPRLRALGAAGGRLFFSVEAEGNAPPSELWVTDGTPAGTTLVERLRHIVTSEFLRPPSRDAAAVGDHLVFSADLDGTTGLELQHADATGAALLADLRSGTEALAPEGLRAARLVPGRSLVFGIRDEEDGAARELFVSKGHEADTVALRRFPHADIVDGATVGDTLFFPVTDQGTSETAIWQSDGTVEGTRPYAQSFGEVLDMAPAGDSVLLVVGGAQTSEIWRLTPPNQPARVASIMEASVVRVIDAAGTVFFTSRGEPLRSMRLWRLDGSQPRLLRDFGFQSAVALQFDPVTIGSTVFLSVFAGSFELWRSDGTEATTRLVRRFDGKGLLGEAVLGGRLFLQVNGELWESDGATEEGTRPVPDLPVAISTIAAVGEQLFLTGDDGQSGEELWRSDGTAAGTVQVADIRAGTGSSSPYELAGTSDRLFFLADDGVHGHELWALPLGAGSCGDGQLDSGEQCDDGNTGDDDCCSATCRVETAGTACDDGDPATAGDACDGAGRCVGGPRPTTTTTSTATTTITTATTVMTTTTTTVTTTTSTPATITTTTATSSTTRDTSTGTTTIATTSTGTSSSATSTTAPPTTTTLPCRSVRCTLDDGLGSAACAGETIPPTISKNFDRASSLIEQAESTPRKAKRLLRRAKKILLQSAKAAGRAGKGKTPKLTAGCAATIQQAADGIRTGLGV